MFAVVLILTQAGGDWGLTLRPDPDSLSPSFLSDVIVLENVPSSPTLSSAGSQDQSAALLRIIENILRESQQVMINKTNCPQFFSDIPLETNSTYCSVSYHTSHSVDKIL